MRKSAEKRNAVRKPFSPLTLGAVIISVIMACSWLATEAHAYYNVTIGTASANGAWAGNVWTPSGSGSTVAASEIETRLGSGPVTISIGSGGDGGAEAGDITGSTAVTWSANRLTLIALRNIEFNANLNGSGTASLWLAYGQGAVAAGNTATYSIGNGVRISLPASLNFLTRLGSDGPMISWMVINSLGAAGSTTTTDLQGMAGNLAGNYVLGADIDASATSGWNDNGSGGFYGFAPVGTLATSFTGRFDGLGHTITGLTINRPAAQFVGLFGMTTGALRNVGLVNGSVSGLSDVGMLAGRTFGAIDNSYAAGGSVTGIGNNVGGLVGTQKTGSTISGSYATSSVTGAGNNYGGLAGNAEGTISNSYATGSVTGNGSVGGLVGLENSFASSISNSYATGAVSGDYSVGGLVGDVLGTIATSYATGFVSGNSSVGGLVGTLRGTVANSFWNPQTTGRINGFGVNFGGDFQASSKGTLEMRSLATFAGWDIDATGGTGKVWRIYEGYTYPLLRSFMTTLNLTPDYDGSGAAMGNVAAYTTSGAYDAAKVLGSTGNVLVLSSTAANGYTATLGSGLYSTQQGYNLVTTSRSISTPGSAAGHIVLANPVAWTSGTLAINTSGTITQSAAVNGTGTAIFDLRAGTWSQMADPLPAFAVHDFRISGGSFLRALSGDGSGGAPYQLADIYGVQGMGSSGMLGLQYLLAGNVDASTTSGWNGGAGFAPVGNSGAKFTGRCNGNGNTISGLFINRPATDNVGLFGFATGASLENIGLASVNVTGQYEVGALAGTIEGTGVSASRVEGGSVAAAGGIVGALLGSTDLVSIVSDSHAAAGVSGTDWVGGLVGSIGDNSEVIDSYATGAVQGIDSNTGGLVGSGGYSSAIRNSYATGSVNGGDWTGGLAGKFSGTITGSYATGPVVGSVDLAGGLIGQSNGTITDCYATGYVTGHDATGGLAGANYGTISNTYAIGRVIGYSSGGHAGGLVGSNYGTVNASFWDTQTSWQASGTGPNIGTFNATGKTTAEMKQLATFAGWDIDATGGTGKVWRIYEGFTNPLLRGFLTGLTATVDSGSKTYDSTAAAGLGVTYSTAPNANLLGTAVTTAASANVGTWAVSVSGLYSNQQGYDITFAGGTLTIDPALLFITTSDVTKAYDGTTSAAGTAIPFLTILYGTDSLSGGTFTFANKNAGSNKVVTVSGVTVNDGNDSNNYAVTYVAAIHSTITPASLTITTGAVAKTFDGTTDTAGTAIVSMGTLYNGDTISGGSFAFADKNAGTGKSVAVSGVTVNDGNGGNNYTVTYADNTASTINPAALTVTINNVTKTYDGTTAAAATAVVTAGTLFGTDSLSGGSFAFTDKNAGSNKTVTVSGVAVSDGNGGNNYAVTYSDNTASTINPAPLTVIANNADKLFDGLAWSGGNGVTYAGWVNGETSAVLGGTLAWGGTSQGAVNPGSYVLTPSGLTSGNYAISFIDGTLTISKADQTITFAPLPDRTYGDADFPISATASSGLAVSFASTTSAVCTVSGTLVSLVAPGTCSITASQGGDANYNPAVDVSRSFMVNATVTPSAGANGSISPDVPQVVAYNTTASFTIVPASGYHVDAVGGTCGGSFTGDPADTVNGILYTTNAVTVDCTVQASFAINQYTVAAVAGPNGSLDSSMQFPQGVDHGSTTGVIFHADAGYYIASITGCGINYVNGEQSITTRSETTPPITGDCTVNAAFAINTHQLTIIVEGKGRVTADNGGIDCPGTCTGTYDHNTIVTLTPTPERDGKFIGWSGDADCEDGVVTMTADLTCTAKFSHFEWWRFWPVIMKAAQGRQQEATP